MISGLCTLPPAWLTGTTFALPSVARGDLMHHLAEVEFGHHKGFHTIGQFADMRVGERPG